jgi:hypothetical protein
MSLKVRSKFRLPWEVEIDGLRDGRQGYTVDMYQHALQMERWLNANIPEGEWVTTRPEFRPNHTADMAKRKDHPLIRRDGDFNLTFRFRVKTEEQVMLIRLAMAGRDDFFVD